MTVKIPDEVREAVVEFSVRLATLGVMGPVAVQLEGPDFRRILFPREIVTWPMEMDAMVRQRPVSREMLELREARVATPLGYVTLQVDRERP